MKLPRLFSASLLLFASMTSLSANALSLTYIGPKNITEEVESPAESEEVQDPDLLFSKKELKVIGQREVVKGVCRSGHRVKIFQTELGWVAEGPHSIPYTPSLSPADMAFLACGEAVPSFNRVTPSNAGFVAPAVAPTASQAQTPAKKRQNE